MGLGEWGGVIFQLSVIVGFIAVFFTYPAFHEQRDTLLRLFSTCPMHWFADGGNKGLLDANTIVRTGDNDRLFSRDELTSYDGSEGSKGLCIAVLGSVYDVSAGKKHYGPGSSYSFFSGKDASRAFVTGDFTETGLTNDVSDFSSAQWLDLLHWFHFYEKTYRYIGKVVGHFYDENGAPSAILQAAQASVDTALAAKHAEDEQEKIFPPCNSQWSDSSGTTVWCTNKSGGIERDWVGVPRLFFDASTQRTKCVCVRSSGPPTDKTMSDVGRGDLDHPSLRQYAGCAPHSEACAVVPRDRKSVV